MNINNIRLQNISILEKQLRGFIAVARALTPIQEQLNQLISVRFPAEINDMLAVKIEHTFTKPEGWLDKQHMNLTLDYFSIPLLSWTDLHDIDKLQQHISSNLNENNYVSLSTANISNAAFALKINNDCMEAPQGITCPVDSIVIIDPTKPAKNRSLILAVMEEAIIFRQLIIENNNKYLNPLNSRYPMVEIKEKITILGVACQIVIEGI